MFGFPTKSTELNRKICFAISGLRIQPLVENVETVNEAHMYLTVSIYDEKKLDPVLLLPHFCFRIQNKIERGEQLSLNTAL